MLGLNLEAMAKAEIAKVEAKLKAIDSNHDGLSDVAEIEKLAQEGVADIELFESKITPAEVSTLLNTFFPGKFSADEITRVEAGFGKLLTAFERLQSLASVAESAL